jgi:hypothetical protein
MNDLDLLPHEWWDLTKASGRTLAPITFWRKRVLHHRASKIRVHIHLSIEKSKIG